MPSITTKREPDIEAVAMWTIWFNNTWYKQTINNARSEVSEWVNLLLWLLWWDKNDKTNIN